MSRRPDLHVPTARLPQEKAEEVLAELDRVLGSPLFRASRRCQTLLRARSELTLDGDVDSLEREGSGYRRVFGRPADYDTSQDPVVRATAAEIRKKLAQYYVEAGHESEVRIELPSGSYHADFISSPGKRRLTGAIRTSPASSDRGRSRPLRLCLAGDIDSCPVELAALRTGRFVGASPEDVRARFWSALGCRPPTTCDRPKRRTRSRGLSGRLSGAPARPIRADDLVLLRDRYVALDDALCLVRMTSLLERYRKAYRIRAEHSTSFADLRDTPAVLIGAFDNPWTLRASGQLRFTFSKDSEHDIGMVHDSQQPGNSQWKLTNYWPEWDIPMDYAIVTRMVDTTTDRPVIIAAGLTQYGTIGAGEFVTKPEYFSEAARRLPRNWQRKNLQIVLSVPVVNRISGRPRILATHVW